MDALLSARVAAENARYPTVPEFASQEALPHTPQMREVLQENAEAPLTDEQREMAIYRAGVAMQAAYSQFKLNGRQQDLDRAYRHMQQIRELHAGRSPEMVARMEAERGLR